MNEFEFRSDRTTDYGVSCPWASKKYSYRPYNGENGVSTFSLLFLIGSFWYFHVTRTSIKAWMSLNFLKWDLTLAHWTQVSDHCPLGYLFFEQKKIKDSCLYWIFNIELFKISLWKKEYPNLAAYLCQADPKENIKLRMKLNFATNSFIYYYFLLRWRDMKTQLW